MRKKTLCALVLAAPALLALFYPVIGLPPALPGLQQSRVVLDRSGQPILTPLSPRGEQAAWTADIPARLKRAFILAEDQRFFSHPGVDARALGRALYQSATHMAVVSGASTLTMQLARITWPGVAPPSAKLAQMVQALRLEHSHSKEELLSRYLNVVPFAHRVAGVGQGCLYFFGKDCSQLSHAESAALAVIPRNPRRYTGDQGTLTQARNRLLRRMAEEGALGPLDLEQALTERVRLKAHRPLSHAAHFALRALRETPRAANGDGKIRTTLDLALQQVAEAVLRQDVEKHPELGDAGAVLVIDNTRAEVLAYVGSADYFQPGHGMLDAVTRPRSPGSALKPFLYALALKQGFNLATPLPDLPVPLRAGSGIFLPDNYGGSFSGPRPLRFALANSKNLPALYLASQLGETRVLEYLRRMGLSSLNESAGHYGAGLALGNGEVTLWNLAQAYSTLARLGIKRPLTYLSDDKTPRPASRVIDERDAYLIAEALADGEARAEEFGRGGPLEFDGKVAVKTGTSSDYRDHWTLGFSREFTVGVWRGNADGRALTARVPASRGSALIFRRVMEQVAGPSPRWLSRPAGLESRRVCSLSGKLAGPNCPGGREELFRREHEPGEKCDMHRAATIADCQGGQRTLRYVALPGEYAPWAEAGRLPTLAGELWAHCRQEVAPTGGEKSAGAPRIVSPLPGTVLALDPTIPPSHQQLRILLENTRQGDKVMLYIDGEPLGDVSGQTLASWPLARGEHRVELKDPSGQTAHAVAIRVL